MKHYNFSANFDRTKTFFFLNQNSHATYKNVEIRRFEKKILNPPTLPQHKGGAILQRAPGPVKMFLLSTRLIKLGDTPT
jgi:hypothetical protein